MRPAEYPLAFITCQSPHIHIRYLWRRTGISEDIQPAVNDRFSKRFRESQAVSRLERDNIQPEVDIAQVNAVAYNVYSPNEWNGMIAGTEADKCTGRIKCRLWSVECDLLWVRWVRDVHDPDTI